ncbi:MAG: hypothetical protein QM817_26025 [Archangium sp.]
MTPQPPAQSAVPPAPQERTGLIIGMGLIGLCCFPLGLAAGILGLMSFLAARQAGRSPSIASIIGMTCGGLSIAMAIGASVWSAKMNAARADQSASIKKAVDGKRGAATLDAETACGLSKLYFLGPENPFFDSIECPGALTGDGDVKMLAGVVTLHGTTKTETSLCLARGRRWFVLGKAFEGACPDEAPKAKGTAPGDDAGLEAEETRWRDEEKLRQGQVRITRFDGRVAVLRDAIEQWDNDPVDTCAKTMPKKDLPRRIAFLERRMLGDDRAFDDWDFLTHGEFRGARALSTHPPEQAKSIEALEGMGAFVVVFDPDTRLWPKTISDDDWEFGEFDGRLLVANFETGTVLCAMDFTAKSSKDVTTTRLTKLETKQHALQRAIEKDFKKQVKAKSEAALKQLTGGALELDFGFFD